MAGYVFFFGQEEKRPKFRLGRGVAFVSPREAFIVDTHIGWRGSRALGERSQGA